MRIMIVGSGAASGLIGARLVERGADAMFVARRERKVQRKRLMIDF
jgi:ketopantoate reductase